MNSPLAVEVIVAQGIVVGHLPPRERLAKAIESLEKSELKEQADTLRDVDKRIRDNPDLTVERRTYPWKPYSYGDELEARRGATKVGERGPEFDIDSYHIGLISKCLNFTEEYVLAMAPALVAALRAEISARCNPTEEALLFFALPPTTSPEETPSADPE